MHFLDALIYKLEDNFLKLSDLILEGIHLNSD
jgi:hypothetical protein